ncbi:DNA-binding transcriptional ArsR family regulator [Methanofollis sp. W23]|uniref:winged helix-turn-helix domain-containing protein n=1 Tax=Methanofollis sp. W23 TaxID=2817849 RepID=UPI001AE7C539|nr:winged helix-turn-helix domain-containing protein [Methanofollis sp. W23]MBP2144772.1 DNA-binding transcriptional ArsR family regulator [Methanofollis sp. W23]
MLPQNILLNRETLEVLASEQRVQIMKHLDEKRMTLTELSQEMQCAKSTVHHHVEKLMASGLITDIDEGHRWIYLELTLKGRMILHPSEKTRIVLLLTSIPITFSGGIVLLTVYLNQPVRYTGDVFPLWNLSDLTFLVGGIGLLGSSILLATYIIFRRIAILKSSTEKTPNTD